MKQSSMLECRSKEWGRIIHRVDASACRAIMLRRGCGGLKHITVIPLWVQEAVREYSIAIERVPRDVMHAHVLASQSSAEELRKHCLQRQTERPRFEVRPVMMMGESGSPAATMSRSFDWDNDTCRPVLDRAHLLASVVNWDEFHALLFVSRSLLSELAKAKVKRNISKW